jgi:AcrR family transcriptional regulator
MQTGASELETSSRRIAGSSVDMRRASILEAMVSVVCEQGFAGASVARVCGRAGVSRRSFYDLFDCRRDCFLAVLDEGCRRVEALISSAFKGAEDWRDGVRSALAALLSFFDAHPQLARVWLIESQTAGRWALERREHNIQAVTRLIVQRWPLPRGVQIHPLANVAVIGSLLAIIQSHILENHREPLITLLGPLVGLAAAPYLDRPAANNEMRRATALAQQILASHAGRAQPVSDPGNPGELTVPAMLRDPRAHRARACLYYVAQHPGASNRQVADGIGITRHDQISRLLTRLAQKELLTKQRQAPGHSNAWTVTHCGARILLAMDAYTGDTSGHAMDLSHILTNTCPRA